MVCQNMFASVFVYIMTLLKEHILKRPAFVVVQGTYSDKTKWIQGIRMSDSSCCIYAAVAVAVQSVAVDSYINSYV